MSNASQNPIKEGLAAHTPANQPPAAHRSTSAKAKEILKQRALKLAESQAKGEDYAETVEILEFRLGDEHYALPDSAVKEVIAVQDLTPVPGADPSLLGLVNVRSRVISLFDLRTILGLPTVQSGKRTQAILMGRSEPELGIAADEILGVRNLPPLKAERALKSDGLASAFVRGVSSDRLIVLDADLLVAELDQESEDKDTPIVS